MATFFSLHYSFSSFFPSLFKKIKQFLFFQNAFSDDDALKELGMLARKVTDALQDLLRYYIRDIEGRLKGGKYEDQIEMILAATERLINSLGNAQETVKSAKTVAMVKPIGNQSFIVLIFVVSL